MTNLDLFDAAQIYISLYFTGIVESIVTKYTDSGRICKILFSDGTSDKTEIVSYDELMVYATKFS